MNESDDVLLSTLEADEAAGDVTAGSSPSEIRVKGHEQGHCAYNPEFIGLVSILT